MNKCCFMAYQQLWSFSAHFCVKDNKSGILNRKILSKSKRVELRRIISNLNLKKGH